MEYGERLTITTPEGVELDLALAGIGSRFIATMLDILIQAAIGIVSVLVISNVLEGGVETLVLSIGAFLLFFGYDVAFEVLAGGRTPGKRATGLRVVRESGAPVTFAISAIRNILRLVDILPIFYGVAMTAIFFTRNHQRLGDLAAGTIVVRERLGGRAPSSVAVAGEVVPKVFGGAGPAGWDISAVTAEDLAIVRQFLDRRSTLTVGARRQIADDIAARLRAKVAGAPALSSEAFLEDLAAARE